MWVCVCVREREREREREGAWMWVWERVRVCVWVRERECVFMCGRTIKEVEWNIQLMCQLPQGLIKKVPDSPKCKYLKNLQATYFGLIVLFCVFMVAWRMKKWIKAWKTIPNYQPAMSFYCHDNEKLKMQQNVFMSSITIVIIITATALWVL